MKTICPCGQQIQHPPNIGGQIIKCDGCGDQVILASDETPRLVGKPQKARKTSAGGIVLEVIGFILLFVFPIGTIIGIALICAGERMSYIFKCPSCHNDLSDKEARVCPACHSEMA
jgi:hypothetical protein